MQHRPNSHIEYLAPLVISSRNCEPVTGIPWESLRELMRAHGHAPLQIGAAKRVFRAADVLAALEAEHAKRVAERGPLTEAEEARALLAELGFEARQ